MWGRELKTDQWPRRGSPQPPPDGSPRAFARAVPCAGALSLCPPLIFLPWMSSDRETVLICPTPWEWPLPVHPMLAPVLCSSVVFPTSRLYIEVSLTYITVRCPSSRACLHQFEHRLVHLCNLHRVKVQDIPVTPRKWPRAQSPSTPSPWNISKRLIMETHGVNPS